MKTIDELIEFCRRNNIRIPQQKKRQISQDLKNSKVAIRKPTTRESFELSFEQQSRMEEHARQQPTKYLSQAWRT